MTQRQAGSELPGTARKGRGPGRPFAKGDPRINRLGVPREVLEFRRRVRQALLEEFDRPSTVDPATSKFSRMVERIVEYAEKGATWEVELILDRLGGKGLYQLTTPNGASDER